MKQLLSLSALLLVVGICSFLYRNAVERPYAAETRACTLEAKVCPDGTSVGRTGPSCTFAACAFPNVEIPDAGISFLVPEGYAADPNVSAGDASLLAAFSKPATLDWPAHSISIFRYTIEEGESAEEIILANVRYQPADEQATDFSRFREFTAGGRTFQEATVERFEGLVYTSYFLARESDVLRFDVVEKGVQGWTEPSLDIRALPEHQALARLLSSLQLAP
jgi:hypothetical protein